MEASGTTTPGTPDSRTKRTLRAGLREARRRVSQRADAPARRTREGAALLRAAEPLIGSLERLAARRAVGDPVVVAAYHPLPLEPDILPLLRGLRARVPGLRILFPVAGNGEELDWAPAHGDEVFQPSSGTGFGREPTGPRLGPDAIAAADVVLAPALAADGEGTRLGQGGGYYDRALRRARAGVRVIAVVHPDELLPAGTLPREEHDAPVDAVLTAAGLHAVGDLAVAGRPVVAPGERRPRESRARDGETGPPAI